MAEYALGNAFKEEVHYCRRWVLTDNDELGPTALLLHNQLPCRASVPDGGQHTIAARIIGVCQPEHAVLCVPLAFLAVRLDGLLRNLCIAELALIRRADRVEQLDLCFVTERESELYQAARCFREVDGHDHAAIRPGGALPHDENRPLSPPKHAFHWLTPKE